MKITNIKNPEEFFKVLVQCEGEVFLVSPEGDKLNLKSKLMQYVAMSKLFSDAKITDLELQVTEQKDLQLLLNYLIRG